MRRVPLKIVDFHGPSGEALPPLHYSEALVLIAVTPQQGGISAEEMAVPLAIKDAIAIASDQPLAEGEERFVFLEEAEWSWLVVKLKANRFPFASRAFEALTDDVEAAPKVDPHQLNGGAPAAQSEGRAGAVPGAVVFSARDL
jgi:hypothetical protein